MGSFKTRQMTARLLASKCSQTVESVAEDDNHHPHMLVDVYDFYVNDSYSR